jgi:hypothetical protein
MLLISIIHIIGLGFTRLPKKAKFLKEYWGIKNGTNQYSRVSQNEKPETSADIVFREYSLSQNSSPHFGDLKLPQNGEISWIT